MVGDGLFAIRLKEEREKRGWTQEYMAGLLGVKSATLSGYERNYRQPDIEMLTKIANLLGVTVDYLIGREVADENELPWYEKNTPPADVDLEKFIKEQPNLSIFGDPIKEEVKDDIILALRTAWQFMNKDRALKKSNKGK